MTVEQAKAIIAKANVKTPDKPPYAKIIEAIKFLASRGLGPQV